MRTVTCVGRNEALSAKEMTMKAIRLIPAATMVRRVGGPAVVAVLLFVTLAAAPLLRGEEPPVVKPLQTIELACGQIVSRPGDIDGNLKQIETLTRQAAQAGARLCLFAEGAITGYVLTPDVLRQAPRADRGLVVERLKRLAAELKIVVAAGTIERSDHAYHVSCFTALPDGQMLVQRKHLLGPDELQAGFQPGPEERTFFEVDGVRMAVVICAETGIPDLRNKLAARGCQVMLLITAGGGGREHIFHPEDLEDPQRLAHYVELMDNVCSVTSALGDCVSRHMAQLAVNLCGDDGVGHYHPGHSSMIDSRGRLVALLPGEYVVDYLAPRLIHGPVVVQSPRIAGAKDVRTPAAEKILSVSRTDDFEVNGRGDAPAWERVPWTPLQLRGDGSHPCQTRVKLLYSATGLYVLMDATDQTLTATLQEDFLDLWKEDVFEFFLWPDERQPLYFEYEISPLGFELPILIPNREGKFFGWRPWHYEGPRKIRRATTATGGPKQSEAKVAGWKAEVFVPYEVLSPLGNVPPEPGTRWRANFYRIDYDDGPSASWDWARVGRSFHEFRKFGTLAFQ